ncbi:MAG TPA: glycoside hydrolase family 2 TIM barrel-domain containing protein, partial [Anseongella sp.]|nr:glycoside hydrolase family 2 TIM barrel-domain containing protein [Anseongella sp.]
MKMILTEGYLQPGRSSGHLLRNLLAALAVFLPLFLTAQKGEEPETEIRYLSGTGYGDTVEWEFFCTAGRNSGKWSTIGVPSCWEQEGFGTYQYGIGFYGKETAPGLADEQGMYRHEFEVPEAWRDRRVRIVFDGSMTDTEVKINGQKAGPVHQGGFYRFRYDITDLLKFDRKNLLEVTVSKESSNASVNLAERRADYWNFGGIFRPVFLEALPASFIDRTAIAARADGSFLAEVYLGSGSEEGLRVKAQLCDERGRPVGEPLSATPAPGSDKVILRGKFAGIRTWTAETPHLYRVRFTLLGKGLSRHVAEERFGFRTFEVREGDGLYLNGQKIILKGINRHSFWPESARTLNRELNYADVRLMKEMNMNAVR